MYSLVDSLKKIRDQLLKDNPFEYNKAIITYLAILIDRVATRQISLSFWDITREGATNPFGKQAIQMVFDYIEVNPFCESSGSALNQLDWITRYIESECVIPFSTILQNASSGEKTQFPEKYITSVVTDPPYYDAIALTICSSCSVLIVFIFCYSSSTSFKINSSVLTCSSTKWFVAIIHALECLQMASIFSFFFRFFFLQIRSEIVCKFSWLY